MTLTPKKILLPSAFFFLLFCALLLTNCAGPRHRCQPPYTEECRQAKKLWQEAIEAVVSINFPHEFGKYRAVIWEDEFDNAWVTKGREIHITRQFIYKLNGVFRKCVAAHELAHLKIGHYYSRSGIIILDSHEKHPSGMGHYGHTVNPDIPRGFGQDQEKEADRLTLRYLERAGIGTSVYLDLLARLKGKDSDPAADMVERIKHIQQ